ncbi:deoxyribose-phosphate aldolase [Massilia sp. PAMC28688]|uniref:deoxyribose-phosphate aldolase n=1 Tax=Massilia sp. PAMC28688 TaxID=2861283 RepID=UPI001C6391E8|nr:deoxyribose-phosphate aldolase [Massilia sp. PAMC28688]QYF94313.1 deoxyribose-phosphate aldolase [Massilia sp. PAMC28688]
MTHDTGSHTGFKRNEAVGLDLGWVNQIKVNRNAADRRAASLANRRTVKKEYQAAWLIKALQCIDLTTLGGDDTPGRVERLCMKAMRPLRTDLMEALGVTGLTTGAVCVYHEMIAPAARILNGRLPIAAVSTAFPAGLASMETKVREIELSVAAGATEIDIVITRQHVLTGNWQALYDEMVAYRQACGEAHVKAILATGDLLTLENVAKASWVCMMAGSDFIKTSTGKEGVNATIPVALTMVRTIREYHEQYGFQVGFKPAGGVATAKSALQYLTLMKEELGREWLEPHLFRIGASSLLTDIERQLEHYVTGNYSANHRHAQP